MEKVKNGASNIMLAAGILFMSCCSAAQFGIIAIVQKYTGWKMPKWCAVIIKALSTAASVVATVITLAGSCGITLPAVANTVGKLCVATTSTTQ